MAIKHIKALAIFGRTEASIGSGASLVASDVIWESEPSAFTLNYEWDGRRPTAQMSTGWQEPVQPGGMFAEGNIVVDLKTAGSGSAILANSHVPMLACGFSSSLSASGAREYEPVGPGTTVQSCALGIYDKGRAYFVSGTMGTVKFTADGINPVRAEFSLKGAATVPAEATMASRSWQATGVLAPITKGAQFTIGGFTPVIRKWECESEAEMSGRTNQNAVNGHSGYVMFGAAGKLTCQIEQDALSNWDPYVSQSNGIAMSVSTTIGSVAGEKISFRFPRCKILNVAESAEGNLALWDLELTPYVSAPDKNDWVKIVVGE